MAWLCAGGRAGATLDLSIGLLHVWHHPHLCSQPLCPSRHPSPQVQRHPPLTREQLLEWGQHWPLSWRPPDASTLPHLAMLAAEEVGAMRRHMAAAWRLAEHNGAEGGVANACLLVDPARDAVVAQAADCTHAHPLQHAAMAAIAAAAEWQLQVWPQEQEQDAAGGGSQQGAAAAGSSRQGAEQDAAMLPAATPAAAGMVHAASGPLADEADGKRRRLEGSHDVRDAAHANGASAAAAGTAAAEADGSSAAAGDGGPGQELGRRPYLCTGCARAGRVPAPAMHGPLHDIWLTSPAPPCCPLATAPCSATLTTPVSSPHFVLFTATMLTSCTSPAPCAQWRWSTRACGAWSTARPTPPVAHWVAPSACTHSAA